MPPPILFVHGMFAHGGVFDAWVEFFEQAGFECHAPSLPGRTPTDLETLRRLGMSDELDVLREVCAGLRQPPIVIGHSMGGLLGQQLAAESACAALVLVGSSPPGVLWAHPRAVSHLLGMLPSILAGKVVQPSYETLRAVVFNALDEQEAREQSAMIVADSGRAFRSQVLGTQRVRRGAIKCPVLVLSGESDINGSHGIPRRLAARYGAKHYIVAGADHWIIAPSRVRHTCPPILEWLDEVGLARLAPGVPSHTMADNSPPFATRPFS